MSDRYTAKPRTRPAARLGDRRTTGPAIEGAQEQARSELTTLTERHERTAFFAPDQTPTLPRWLVRHREVVAERCPYRCECRCHCPAYKLRGEGGS
jgi:hypothetical protein